VRAKRQALQASAQRAQRIGADRQLAVGT